MTQQTKEVGRYLAKQFRNSSLGWGSFIELTNVLSLFHFPAVDGIQQAMGWNTGTSYGLNAIIPAIGFGLGWTGLEALKLFSQRRKARRTPAA